MSDFIQDALQANVGPVPSWLQPLRDAGRSNWQAASLPTRKTENWRYTSLRQLSSGNYLAGPENAQPDKALVDNFHIANLQRTQLVFINGQYQPDLSTQELPGEATLVRFSDADNNQAKLIKEYLGSVVPSDQHLFSALNDSWLTDGVFLYVPASICLESPIEVLWITRSNQSSFSLAQRLLVVLEDGSEATIIEHFCSEIDRQNAFTNGITELVVGQNARLTHYRLHLEEENALHIGGVHVDLKRNAHLNSFYVALGSQLKRLDLVVNHRGEGAHCELNGVYLPRHKQHVDFHTNIEHAVPNCTTNEVFRGIVSDQAKAVFNGRIHIHRDAQKTSAQLSNKNLLTSNQAEVDTKPELEIYADDVQCAHGATVSQIDEQLLYYLRARGISRKEAEVMLSFGFINELLNKVKHSEIGDYLRPILAGLFARDSKLTRHIL